jgi:hypothetical protein
VSWWRPSWLGINGLILLAAYTAHLVSNPSCSRRLFFKMPTASLNKSLVLNTSGGSKAALADGVPVVR